MFLETDRALRDAFVEYLERVGRTQSTQVVYTMRLNSSLWPQIGP